MAEQKVPVRRRVALNVIKPGMDTHAVVARFEAERQARALMEHSHIAKVFDRTVWSAAKARVDTVANIGRYERSSSVNN